MKKWILLGTLLLSFPLIAKEVNLDPSNGLGTSVYKEKKAVRNTASGTGVGQESKKKPGSIMNPGGKLGGENGWRGQ